MNTHETRKQIMELKNKYDALREQLELTHQQELELRRQYAEHLAEKYLGLKVGDVIEYVKKSWRKTETVRIQITHFSASLRDLEYEDKHPTVYGVRILKSGQIGSKEESIYSHENIKWTKIELDTRPGVG